MARFAPGLLLTALLFAAQLVLQQSASERKEAGADDISGSYVLPAPLLKVSALEFDGLVSDLLYLRSIVFIGGTYDRKEATKLTAEEGTWLYEMLAASTGIDPYFLDPYLIANANLAWKAGMVDEANILLQQGSAHRAWDWQMPFFIGFNSFYFLEDQEKAAEYLMEASRRPAASPVLASLASKMMFKTGKREAAVMFLQEMVDATDDPRDKQMFEKRLAAFQGLVVLEKAVDAYRARFKGLPKKPDDLITAGIIAAVPVDPYGGNYYMDANGTVRTTSEEQLMPYLRKK